ncbi:cysteine-rich receptor-like protein kinase 46 [Cornus florida]|uniref:cysteine-rich receptor-like protein kinase 46 n=1 Tax=Cornus florida TaxID=4283 RepID=UPI0028A1FCF6|nr:cysteine-rich receptor-like protein kinase 46 [Cornus florida]
MTISDPQINILNKACSSSDATTEFFRLLNATFLDVGSQLSNNKFNNTHFSTTQRYSSSYNVYTMFQCRNYLSTADCIACFDAAVSEIRTCLSSIGAHVTYDGCFLRYENYIFDNQPAVRGSNIRKCGDQIASQPNAFDEAVKASLADLEIATPKISGFFAATKREVAGGSAAVYAVAQCAETLTENGCKDCLNVSFPNIQSCSPYTDGSAIDIGCFLRYSETPFFADNQATNITSFVGGVTHLIFYPNVTGSTGDNQTIPFLGGGSTGDRNNRLKIIIGISAGVFGLILVSVLTIICYHKRNDLSGNYAMVFWRKKTIDDGNVDALIRNYGSLTPKR